MEIIYTNSFIAIKKQSSDVRYLVEKATDLTVKNMKNGLPFFKAISMAIKQFGGLSEFDKKSLQDMIIREMQRRSALVRSRKGNVYGNY